MCDFILLMVGKTYCTFFDKFDKNTLILREKHSDCTLASRENGSTPYISSYIFEGDYKSKTEPI